MKKLLVILLVSVGAQISFAGLPPITAVPATSSDVWIKANIVKVTNTTVTLKFRNNRIFDLPRERVEEKKKLSSDQKTVEVKLKFGELEQIL